MMPGIKAIYDIPCYHSSVLGNNIPKVRCIVKFYIY